MNHACVRSLTSAGLIPGTLLLWACQPHSLKPGTPDNPDDPVDTAPADTAPEDTAPIDTGAPFAWCGDGAVDAGESCDDANNLGGDGCTSTCAVETGAPETEPNDEPETATDLMGGTLLNGGLPAGDVDCWSYGVPVCGAVAVTQQAPCTSSLALTVYDAHGGVVAVGDVDDSGCIGLDPADQPGARWMEGGDYAICVSAIAGAEVPDYAIALASPDSASSGTASGSDLDADGVPDSCDADDDDDGVDDGSDNCPNVSNGPDTAAFALSAEGFVTDWLTAGPFTGDATTGGCRPSEVARVGEDGAFAPALLSPAGEAFWIANFSGNALDLTSDYAYVAAPREAYAFVYLYAATSQTATLSVGADDGAFVWWNGARVIDEATCQGVNTDQFQAAVTVQAGVNTLLLKVYDQGGGWGLIARLFDSGGAPITSLVPQLGADPGWRPDQTDTDGDGIGDACE